MRTLAALALALALAALAPGVRAHSPGGEAQAHLEVRPVQLDAGESRSYAIETGEGPWEAGMVFVLFVQFHNANRDLRVDLTLNHSTIVKTWNLTGATHHRVAGRIPLDEGPYELALTNRAANQTQLFFYFDQTCNCTYKPIPLDEGWVVFHYDLLAGTRYRLQFPLGPEWTVQGTLATLEDERADYPGSFRVVEERTATGPDWINFTLEPDEDRRHLVFFVAKEGSPAIPNPRQFVAITPLVETDEKKAPAAGLLAALAGLLVGAVGARRRF